MKELPPISILDFFFGGGNKSHCLYVDFFDIYYNPPCVVYVMQRERERAIGCAERRSATSCDELASHCDWIATRLRRNDVCESGARTTQYYYRRDNDPPRHNDNRPPARQLRDHRMAASALSRVRPRGHCPTVYRRAKYTVADQKNGIRGGEKVRSGVWEWPQPPAFLKKILYKTNAFLGIIIACFKMHPVNSESSRPPLNPTLKIYALHFKK